MPMLTQAVLQRQDASPEGRRSSQRNLACARADGRRDTGGGARAIASARRDPVCAEQAGWSRGRLCGSTELTVR